MDAGLLQSVGRQFIKLSYELETAIAQNAKLEERIKELEGKLHTYEVSADAKVPIKKGV